MEKSDNTISQAILKSAIAEFQKGYHNASLRAIARNAGTTTGSIYTRYRGKQELFEMAVGETAEGLKEIITSCLENVCECGQPVREQPYKAYYSAVTYQMADFVYRHYEAAQVLIEHSGGTAYQDYISQLCSLELEYSEQLWPEKQTQKGLSDDVIFLLTKAYYTEFFTLIFRNNSKGIQKYIDHLITFHISGWAVILEKLKAGGTGEVT